MKASIGLTIFVFAAAPALAQPPETTATLEAEFATEAETASSVDQAVVVAGNLDGEGAFQQNDDETLSLEELGELRGGEAIVIQHTTQTLTATNRGNSVTGDTIGSGAVNLGANAFNGYDGIGNFVINTGHNNNLQGSISVSVAMSPQ